MPAKSKLTPEQWTQVYATWQADPRPALAWLVDELALPISRQGIADRARRDGWTKGGIPSGQPAHELKDKPVRADKATWCVASVSAAVQRCSTPSAAMSVLFQTVMTGTCMGSFCFKVWAITASAAR